MGLRDSIGTSSEDSTSIVPSSDTDQDTDSSGTPDEHDSDSVRVGEYTWEDYVREFGPEEGGYDDIPDARRHDDLKDNIDTLVDDGKQTAGVIQDVIDERTVNVNEDIDEDEFFTNADGKQTIVTRYDLEKAVEDRKKRHFEEIERYWVNKPFAFVVLFRSSKENEVKYYVIEPYLNPEERQVLEFLQEKLQETIKFADEAVRDERSNAERAGLIEQETYNLLEKFELAETVPYGDDTDTDDGESGSGGGMLSRIPGINSGSNDAADDTDDSNGDADANGEESSGFIARLFGNETTEKTIADKLIEYEKEQDPQESRGPSYTYHKPNHVRDFDGNTARPESAVLNEGSRKLTPYQVAKLVYYLKRDSISYGKIDAIKHDIAVEDISCDGYNSRVFVYHEEHEQIISNVEHGRDSLDDFVVKLAQRSGKGISKRQPQVDATLPDGSRAQLTLGTEVSDHGTNYTIRQFQEIPHTPIDLINWKTFSPEQMAFLWLAIENNKSLIFAGGTASGKTTSLNAVSLFIPSNSKIVSIEDTREVELPQRNWVASVTRPSFTEDGAGDIDEFKLLEAALRQRPDYIVMGEVRGEEGRTLFQVMSTGHTTYTTFHADSVGEVIKRFTTDPINVSKTLFTALDLISIQTQTRVGGHKVRRSKILTEVNEYSAETDEINVNDVFEWDAQEDAHEQSENSQVLEQIKFDRGWQQPRLEREIRKREIVLAYLIKKRLNTYTQVAATIQAFINEPDVILNLIAQEQLESSLESLREMESVMVDIDQEKEDMVPRPEPTDDTLAWVNDVLTEARSDGGVLDGREEREVGSIADVLSGGDARDENISVHDEETEDTDQDGDETDGDLDDISTDAIQVDESEKGAEDIDEIIDMIERGDTNIEDTTTQETITETSNTDDTDQSDEPDEDSSQQDHDSKDDTDTSDDDDDFSGFLVDGEGA